jgi:hypothetical protein
MFVISSCFWELSVFAYALISFVTLYYFGMCESQRQNGATAILHLHYKCVKQKINLRELL